MNDKAYHIRKRFPDENDAIDLLMAHDPEFRTICEDYDACVNALRYWIESKEPEAELRIKEYRSLIEELEEEVAQAFSPLKTQRSDLRGRWEVR
jgi:hypothetical protein